MLKLNYFRVEIVIIYPYWCTHRFLDYSKQTNIDKYMGFKTKEV